ncbi:TetR/AcrR family transcriptional regulator [Myceligenerans pegani]|uniref:TetR/AcrR family transcriptional regulator n=1 Tax=Myceligenerans pegani TaxID=2776917 RepID=A0ABR9N4P7_9MICO|nr:TetR/AcrR family transcriptional regulator [Myceligenerans sp. TRM 65318]MBE1878079.1 TetR/AcrR family transcriptional regulator [Myceligenerans sp. TRM 65318]MBE3020350.1 TetR/AcrR family transcriptional regulator [Myceligenerans sp. TRM 65318]
MKTPPPELAGRLLNVSEQVLYGDPPPRLADVAGLVGASRATLYYYFAGRDDLVAFLLTSHARQGAEVVRAAVDPDDPPEARLRTTIGTLARFLGDRPGICAGLLGGLAGNLQLREALDANDTWIAGPLRDLLGDGAAAGVLTVDDVGDAANAVLGALLLGVLGRSASGADAADRGFQERLTEQIVRGVLR